MVIDRCELIRIFDERRDVRQHAAAIKAVAGDELGLVLLVKFLRSQRHEADILPGRCTTGLRKGPRLDGWVRASSADGVTYYQVEVKNWSRHSAQGRPLAFDASPPVVADFKQERWNRYWDGTRFRDKELNKVLVPMRPPEANVRVEPLACLWDAVHRDGLLDPMFSVPVTGHFQRAWVFSMSAFLRSLDTPTLELELPCASERLRLLAGIFLPHR